MAFVEMNQKLQYRKLALWNEGDVIQGVFESIKSAGVYKGNESFQAIIRVTEDPNFEDYKGNEIKKGNKFGFPITRATEDYFIEDYMGNEFQIEYKGKQETKDGTNDYHTFKILMSDKDSNDTVSNGEVSSTDL